MNSEANPESVVAGVVGLGLMGRSIVTALLISGHHVKAVAPVPTDTQQVYTHLKNQLEQCFDSGLLTGTPADYIKKLTVSEHYSILKDCGFVMECVLEDMEIKKDVYRKITSAVSDSTVIGTNTSAIPISDLQQVVEKPERFMGIHWAEPAFLTRFLEIICGRYTDPSVAQWVMVLAQHWGKEPTLLRKDIRGFITNRLMYAVYRELFHLIEKEGASMTDLDKAFRYDPGSWMTLMGIFRRADFQGLEDFTTAMENLFPLLSVSGKVPEVMQQIVERKGRGIYNQEGLFDYSKEEAREWEEAFAHFNSDINKLAAGYTTKKINELTKK